MKLSALIVFAAATTGCGAADLATQLTVARIDYDLPTLERPAGHESLAFRIFVRLALSDDGYVIAGTLKAPEVGDAGGSLTLIERSSQERGGLAFVLTHAQAREVYGWLSDAKFLDPKTDEIVDTPVLDGDEILIEGFVAGRYFRVRRNSGDSAVSAAFFRRVQMFRTWKAEPNQPPQHNAGSRPSSSDSPASETPSSLGPRG